MKDKEPFTISKLPEPESADAEYEIVGGIKIYKNAFYQPLTFNNPQPVTVPDPEIERADERRKLVAAFMSAQQRKAPLQKRHRSWKMEKHVLDIIDTCISRQQSPMQCLRGKLRTVSCDSWLKNLQDDYPDIKTFGDIADRSEERNKKAFERFKGVYYRRKRRLSHR